MIRLMMSTKTSLENTRRKLETPMAAAMPCKMRSGTRCLKDRKAKTSEAKTRFSCIAEAHEFTRQRKESVTKRIHEEHIAGKGQNSVVHYSLFANQLKPRERAPMYFASIGEPRWDSDPIASESRSWPDEDANSFFSARIRSDEKIPRKLFT